MTLEIWCQEPKQIDCAPKLHDTTTPIIPKSPRKLTSSEKLAADIIIYSCTTVLAPLCLPPFLLGVGVFDFFIRGRITKKMKRVALGEALFFFMIIVISATVGLTLSIKEDRRANGEDF